jgi:hypothetical protein
MAAKTGSANRRIVVTIGGDFVTVPGWMRGADEGAEPS